MRKKSNLDWVRIIIGTTLTCSAFLLTWAAFSWATFTDFLVVEHVKMPGSMVMENEYRSLLRQIDGKKMNQLELDNIRIALESHPYVRAARVSRQFPNTVTIEILEREPIAIVRIDPPVLIDSESVVLPIKDNNIEYQMPSLSKFNSAKSLYPLGKSALSQNVLDAVSYVTHIKINYPNLYENLSEVRLNRHEEFELILEEEPTLVSLGKTNITEKLFILKEFDGILPLGRKLTDYRYLDLRYKNQIIARERST